MSSNYGFGLAWWLVAGLYALLACGSRDPIALGLSVAFGAVSVLVALRYQCRWADERVKRINS